MVVFHRGQRGEAGEDCLGAAAIAGVLVDLDAADANLQIRAEEGLVQQNLVAPSGSATSLMLSNASWLSQA